MAQEHGNSLLDVLLQRLEESGRSLSTISRVTMVGKLRPTAAPDAFALACKGAVPSDGSLNGLLLLLQTGFCQTVEGPSATLVAFLRAMEAQCSPDGLCESCKVIGSQEDVTAAFAYWGFKELSVQRGNYMDVDDAALPALLADAVVGAPTGSRRAATPRAHAAPRARAAAARLPLLLHAHPTPTPRAPQAW